MVTNMAEESRQERPSKEYKASMEAWNSAEIDEVADKLWGGDDRDREFGRGSKLVHM